jgi:hypothetical protein
VTNLAGARYTRLIDGKPISTMSPLRRDGFIVGDIGRYRVTSIGKILERGNYRYFPAIMVSGYPMTRRRKTLLLLLISPLLYAAGRVSIQTAQPVTLVFFAVFVGILSYGYIVMEDGEFVGNTKGKLLLPFALACAGCTSIVKVFVDALLSHSLPAASIAAGGLWSAVLAFVLLRTALFKNDQP